MNDHRHYRYIGPQEIIDKLPTVSHRLLVQSAADVLKWITDTQQERDDDGNITVTFIVNTQQELWINDRRSEHVLCAAGKDVLSAGEMTFAIENETVEVIDVTNQSTGYCPEPESWWAVEAVLNDLGIPHQEDFTSKFVFRLCENCGTKNIVKDDWYVCGVCDQPLSETWNFDRPQ